MTEFVLYSVDFYTFDTKPVARYVVENAPTLCEIIADILVHQHAIHGPDTADTDDIVIDMLSPSARVEKMMLNVTTVLANDLEAVRQKLRPLMTSCLSVMVDAPESEHYFLICTRPRPYIATNQMTINL